MPDSKGIDVVGSLTAEPQASHSWQVNLADKIIAITGANQGIGLGVAEVCLMNSAKVVYSLDISDPADEFTTLQAKHRNLKYVRTDVTQKGSIEKAIASIYEQEGRLDGFVANAGMTKHQPALEFDDDQLHQIFELNVFGTYHCATAVAQSWIERGITGSIVFTASMTSYRPNRAAPSAPYGGTKAAVRNMAHTLAMEWAKHGIRVNSVSPGFVRTAMTTYMEGSPDWELKMKYYGGMPRLAKPQELGGAYVYLLSDAASYTTGIDIPVAGIVGAW
ncbi:hypothetical protein G7Y79_00067g095500 [Physcia stellaris]|nr:hypothetical protein G7Y79_00067g095500 [Physcia stellaris]